jgi:hypothetical protein
MARDLNGDHGEYHGLEVDNVLTKHEMEDSKTLKAVMFLLIQEHVKQIPNDQELGKRIRKIVNKFNEENENN